MVSGSPSVKWGCSGRLRLARTRRFCSEHWPVPPPWWALLCVLWGAVVPRAGTGAVEAVRSSGGRRPQSVPDLCWAAGRLCVRPRSQGLSLPDPTRFVSPARGLLHGGAGVWSCSASVNPNTGPRVLFPGLPWVNGHLLSSDGTAWKVPGAHCRSPCAEPQGHSDHCSQA